MADPLSGRQLANAVRFLISDAIASSGKGHSAFPIAMSDAASVLFSRFLSFDPKQPHWPNRDRVLVASAGGRPLLLSLLHLLGFDRVDLPDVAASADPETTAPDLGARGGIEMTASGEPGAVAIAVGLALAERRLAGEFGSALINHRTYCLADATCLNEPVNRRAMAAAGELELSKLVLVEAVYPQGDSERSDELGSFCAEVGWQVEECASADIESVADAFAAAAQASRPVLVRVLSDVPCDVDLSGSKLAEMDARLGRTQEERFEVSSEIKDRWRLAGLKSASRRKEWDKTHGAEEATVRGEFDRRMRGDLPTGLSERVVRLKRDFSASSSARSLVDASQAVLCELVPMTPEIFGIPLEDAAGKGDADGEGHHGALVERAEMDDPADALAAALWRDGDTSLASGFGLHGGLIPCGEVSWPPNDDVIGSIRLARHLGVCLVFVALIDGFGNERQALDKYGRPLFHDLKIFRPCDPSEVAECWELALDAAREPVVIVISDLEVPSLRPELLRENPCGRGGYEISPAGGMPDVTLFAAGIDVHLALAIAERVRSARHRCRVISLPGMTVFRNQSAEYRSTFLEGQDLQVVIGRVASEIRDDLRPGALQLGAAVIDPAEPQEDLPDYLQRVSPGLAARILDRLLGPADDRAGS